MAEHEAIIEVSEMAEPTQKTPLNSVPNSRPDAIQATELNQGSIDETVTFGHTDLATGHEVIDMPEMAETMEEPVAEEPQQGLMARRV